MLLAKVDKSRNVLNCPLSSSWTKMSIFLYIGQCTVTMTRKNLETFSFLSKTVSFHIRAIPSAFNFLHVLTLSVDDAKAISILIIALQKKCHTTKKLNKWLWILIFHIRLVKFLSRQNLDALHDHLGTLYPGMRAPSFRCTEEPDGSLILHYYSERAGLEHIVIGIVKVKKVENRFRRNKDYN